MGILASQPLSMTTATQPAASDSTGWSARLITAALSLMLVASQASSQIDANFTASLTSGMNPLTVSFSDTTTGATPLNWIWAFGDGGSSTMENPTHTYTLDGSHTVSLSVVGPGFDLDTETKVGLIDVAPLPLLAAFSESAVQGSNPFAVTFTDLSSGSPTTSWLWDFGDGSQSTDQNPTHVFGAPGIHDVSLTVFIGQQSDRLTKTDLITVDPALLVVDFTATPVQQPPRGQLH
ncbi:MAG: PKD repeat protein [Pseudohongiellaceae bacterium]|jgi:PKD repeat protein